MLFNRSVRDNIAYGQLQDSSDDKVIAAAKAAFAHDFIMNLPQGYDTILGAQRFEPFRWSTSTYCNCESNLKRLSILILDEATSALDNESEYFIQQAF